MADRVADSETESSEMKRNKNDNSLSEPENPEVKKDTANASEPENSEVTKDTANAREPENPDVKEDANASETESPKVKKDAYASETESPEVIKKDTDSSKAESRPESKHIHSTLWSKGRSLQQRVTKWYLMILVIMIVAFHAILPFVPLSFLPPIDVAPAGAEIVSQFCEHNILQNSILSQLEKRCAQAASTSRQTERGVMVANLKYELPPLHLNLMKGFAKHSCNLPQKHGLVSWGPDDNGQHKSLAELQHIWTTQGRVVVDIDMLDFAGNITKFNELLTDAVLHSFSHINLNWRTRIVVLEVLERQQAVQNSIKDVVNLWTTTYNMLKTASSVVIFVPLQLATRVVSFLPYIGNTILEVAEQFYGQRLASIELLMKTFLVPQSNIINDITIETLFPILNTLALANQNLAPVVTITHLDSLSMTENNNSQETLQQLMDSIAQHQFEANVVPVIVISSNAMWLHVSTSIPHFRDLFLPYEVRELDRQQTEHLLVDTMQAWNNSEFSFLWEKVGGYYSSLSLVYKYQQTFDIKLGDAISRELGYQFDILANAVRSWHEEDETHLQDLLKLINKKGYLNLVNVDKSVMATANYLLKWNVMYVDSQLKLKPVSTSMKLAISNYITTTSSKTQ